MKAVLYRVFRKNLLLLLAVAGVFVGAKGLTAYSIAEQKPVMLLLDAWVEQCLSYDDAELEAFIEEAGGQDETEKAACSAFFASYSNRKEVQKLISFAQKHEGVLPYSLPDNYMQLLDFYSSMNTPQVINELPLEMYFDLQAYSIVPILVIILNIVFWGNYYEAEIYKHAITAKCGRSYHRTIRWTLLFLSIGLFFADELFDLVCSQLLITNNLFSASVQSYKEFCGVQMNCSIGMIFVAMWCGKVLNVICLVLFSECFARNKKNLKDAAVYAMLLVIALLFLKNALLNTPCYSVIQIGYVDWKQTLRDTVLLLPGGIPSMVLGITLSAIAAACLCFMFAEKNKVRH